jgi:hypothetical protein
MTKNLYMSLLIACLFSMSVCPVWAGEGGSKESAHLGEAIPSSANSSVELPQSAARSADTAAVMTSAGSSETGGANRRIADAAGTSSTTNSAGKASLPKKALSVATAFFVGTPVCIVRRTKYEEWYGVHSMVGDSDNKAKKVLAGMFWFPFAVVNGTAEAPFDAFANGLMYPAGSKDQQSRGKLIQNN